jgi:septal ring factor EnvC (AmiA/AmiB activator)
MCVVLFSSTVVLDEQKAGVEKEASDLRASLREVEKARLDGRRELQDLRRQLKMIEAERAKIAQDFSEVQSRCAREEERGEEMKKEIFDLRQKVFLLLNILLFTYSCLKVTIATFSQPFCTALQPIYTSCVTGNNVH